MVLFIDLEFVFHKVYVFPTRLIIEMQTLNHSWRLPSSKFVLNWDEE